MLLLGAQQQGGLKLKSGQFIYIILFIKLIIISTLMLIYTKHCWVNVIQTNLQQYYFFNFLNLSLEILINYFSVYIQMANIRTLNNLRNDQANNNRAQPNSGHNLTGEIGNPNDTFQNSDMGITVENIRAAEQHKVMFLSGSKKLKNPKDQNYWDMIRETCCPVIQLLSFTTFILIVDIAMFITSIVMGLKRSGQLLQINGQTLLRLAANQSNGVKRGQVYRLLGAIVLHANFLHFLGNSVTTLIFVSRVEYTYGSIKTGLFYIVSGISGNIFSVLAASSGIKVGASTALYGVLGLIVGYLIINWSGLNKVGPLMKCQLTFVVVIVVVFIIIFTSASQNIDYFGHIGGFMAGAWLSAFHKTIIDQLRQKIIRGIFIVLLISQFLIFFLIFYLKK